MTRSILVALDTTERAAQVLATAVDMADRLNADLHIFGALDVERSTTAADHARPPGKPTPNAYSRGQALAQLVAFANSHTRGRRHPPILGASTAQAVADAAAERGAELIVIGQHRLDWLPALVTRAGSTPGGGVLIVHD